MTNTDKDLLNRDPITEEPGAHPIGTGVGAASGALAGAAIGALTAGPVGIIAGSMIGGIAGGRTLLKNMAKGRIDRKSVV